MVRFVTAPIRSRNWLSDAYSLRSGAVRNRTYRVGVNRCGFKPHHKRQFKERTRLSSRNSRASYIQRKEARELREDERCYSRPLRYLRC